MPYSKFPEAEHRQKFCAKDALTGCSQEIQEYPQEP